MDIVSQIEKIWLFDLSKDPGEKNNVAENQPEKVQELMELLAQHNSEMVPPLWDFVGAMPINIDKHLKQEQNPEKDTYIYWSN